MRSARRCGPDSGPGCRAGWPAPDPGSAARRRCAVPTADRRTARQARSLRRSRRRLRRVAGAHASRAKVVGDRRRDPGISDDEDGSIAGSGSGGLEEVDGLIAFLPVRARDGAAQNTSDEEGAARPARDDVGAFAHRGAAPHHAERLRACSRLPRTRKIVPSPPPAARGQVGNFRGRERDQDAPVLAAIERSRDRRAGRFRSCRV